jgi:hypothetical protein
MYKIVPLVGHDGRRRDLRRHYYREPGGLPQYPKWGARRSTRSMVQNSRAIDTPSAENAVRNSARALDTRLRLFMAIIAILAIHFQYTSRRFRFLSSSIGGSTMNALWSIRPRCRPDGAVEITVGRRIHAAPQLDTAMSDSISESSFAVSIWIGFRGRPGVTAPSGRYFFGTCGKWLCWQVHSRNQISKNAQ